jgi:hypothetical protein
MLTNFKYYYIRYCLFERSTLQQSQQAFPLLNCLKKRLLLAVKVRKLIAKLLIERLCLLNLIIKEGAVRSSLALAV